MDVPFKTLSKPHLIIIEEAGKVPESKLATLFSLYWDTRFIQVGDNDKTQPMHFCPDTINNFASQTKISMLLRLTKAGFPAIKMNSSSRFWNQDLLHIARLVSSDNILTNSEVIDKEESCQATHVAKQHHQKIYRILSPAVHFSVEGVPRQDRLDSAYCIESATVAMHDVQRLDAGMVGKSIGIVVPYKAQKNLLLQLLNTAQSDAILHGREKRTEQLPHVRV